MGKAELQQDLQALYRRAEDGITLGALTDEICALLAQHTDALRGVNGRYRLMTSDTGYARAFALENGAYRELDCAAPVDVTILGYEADLLRVFRRELSPMGALLRGKIRWQGSKAALMRLAEFL